MNLSTYQLALIAGGFTIVGTLIGAGITYRLSLVLAYRNDFNKAAVIFRHVFLPEITFLTHEANIGGLGSGNRLYEILGSGYLRQLKALEIFKYHLPTSDRESIYRAWDEYCHPEGIPKDKNKKRDSKFKDYKSIEESKGTEAAKTVALQKINKILEYANEK